MTIESWTAFLGVLLVVVCTPGPDFAVLLRHALAGPRRGVRAAAGILTGLSVHTAAAALGLSALLAARPDVLTAIRIAGAAYLAWLGVQALRAALTRSPVASTYRSARSAHPYVDGLASNLLNPKAPLFFLGLIPQFVVHGVPGSPVAGQILVLAGTTMIVALLWFGLVIVVAARGRAIVAHSRAVDGVTGAVLVAVAVGVGLAGA